jgi:hypothetical protein
MKRLFVRAFVCICLFALLAGRRLPAQHLTLEGQTGGFITPTAYVVPSTEHHFFSFPAVGYHFVKADRVIGDVHTFNITEGFSNRAEIGYTREVHMTGNDPVFSQLWHFSGMNIVHGKVVLLKDGQFKTPVPGVAAGFVTRWDDKFVTGALDQAFTGTLKNYTNADVYAAVTKTWAHKPLPFLANLGMKFTNASIYGIGGQATRFEGRLFGGLGFPLPGPLHTAIVPAAGFSQQPPTSKNLGAIMYPPGSRAHLPTTLDYAVRFTQRENPHFAFDAGVGQVAGMIGQTVVLGPGGVPVIIPVNLHARSVFGLGLSVRY